MACFVVMKWSAPDRVESYLSGAKSETTYTADHVNRIYRALCSLYSDNLRLLCVTDDPTDLEDGIEVVALNSELRSKIDRYGGRFAKLWLYSPSFREIVKEHFVYLDLDVAICGRLNEFFNNSTSLVVMRGTTPTKTKLGPRRFLRMIFRALCNPKEARKILTPPPHLWCKYNSSIVGVDPYQVTSGFWESLDFDKLREEIKEADLIGTDQAALHLKYNGSVTVVGEEKGYWAFSRINKYVEQNGKLPEEVKVVIFPGHPESKPWSQSLRARHSWVTKLYPVATQ